LIKTTNGKSLQESTRQDAEEPVRLYSDQIVQLHKKKNVVSKSVSLLCPYEEESQRFLQIDMQVMRSRLVHGQFKTQADDLYQQQQSVKRRKLI
jgi:hypothetical protein